MFPSGATIDSVVEAVEVGGCMTKWSTGGIVDLKSAGIAAALEPKLIARLAKNERFRLSWAARLDLPQEATPSDNVRTAKASGQFSKWMFGGVFKSMVRSVQGREVILENLRGLARFNPTFEHAMLTFEHCGDPECRSRHQFWES